MSNKPAQLRFLSPLHRATRSIADHLAPRMARHGCSNDEAHLLSYLTLYGPCPIGQIKQLFGHRGSTLTSMLDRLENRGLLNRAPHPEDRRSTLVDVTQAGRGAAAGIRRELENLESAIAARLDAASIESFQNVVGAIVAATRPTPDRDEENR